MLAEDIGKKLAMAEQVGAEGKVEESMKLMEEVSETCLRERISHCFCDVCVTARNLNDAG